MRRFVAALAIAALAGSARADSTVFYSGETNNMGVQIRDASLRPDNERTGADEHLHISVVGQKRDGSGGVSLAWAASLEKVAGDTEGNYTVSVLVPPGADATYGSVTVTLRLDDAGWGVSREWALAPGRWMPAAQYTPPSPPTVIAGAVVAQITPPPSAQAVAGAVNTTLSSAHGAGLWGQQAVGANVVNVTCRSADPTPVAIPGATVQIRGPETGTLVYYGATGADGTLAANLDAGDYLLYAFKIGQYTFTNPIELTVDEDPETITLTGTAFSPGAPAQPNTCMVYGWARDTAGNLQPNADVIVTFSSPHGSCNGQVVQLRKESQADAGGYWELPCIPNSLIVPTGTSYEFRVWEYVYIGVVVPNTTSAALEDIQRGAYPTVTPTATPTRTSTPTRTPTPTRTATPTP